MAGNLYLPEGMDENKKYPAIVCVHPGGGVKEQTEHRLLAFSAFSQVSTLLTQPLLVIAGSEADTRGYSEQVCAMAKGPKEIFLVVCFREKVG